MKQRAQKHLSALCDISEVFAVLAGSSDIEAFLHRAVSMVADHLDASVSSVYLYDDTASELVLRATVGLSQSSVNSVRMGTDEGLVGLAMREMRPVFEVDASLSPFYKYFPVAGEESYGSFVAVPIQRGLERIGVLTAQRPTGVPFRDQEVLLLQALTSQLAVAIENARVLLSIESPGGTVGGGASTEPLPSLLHGRSGSGGWGCGDSLLKRGTELCDDGGGVRGTIADERGKLRDAVAGTIAQIEHMHETLEQRMPEVASLIFSAHLLMLKDSGFTGKMYALIDEGVSASSATITVAEDYMRIFSLSQHDYMRDKKYDVKDLAVRIVMNLRGDSASMLSAYENRIVVADELLPSDLLTLFIEGVAGLILCGGGVASHAAILARSLEVPLVIVGSEFDGRIPDGVRVLVDANVGNVYIEPDQNVVDHFHLQSDTRERLAEAGRRMRKRTETMDGVRVSLQANINLLSELDAAISLKAEGIGLYRTEFPFLVRQSFPTEEEQVRVYSRLFKEMGGRPVVMRTLDVGGDKTLAYFDCAGERNPELGLRSLRFSFRYEDIFRTQLKAILRSSNGNDLGIMFPMVASLDEYRRAVSILDECARELGHESSGKRVKVGMMIELPSVVEIIDELAEEVGFFSIGTNDFVQYMLAADRTNESVSEYYSPSDPSVLRALSRVIKAIVARGKDVSVCGEMAHDARFVPFFLGLGVRKLSLEPRSLYKIQSLIRGLTLSDAQAYAGSLVACSSGAEVNKVISEYTKM